MVVATNHSEFREPGDARARSPSAPRRDCLVVDPWNCWGAAQVFAYAAELRAAGAARRRRAAREPRARHRRRRHDRRRGRAAPAARPRLRGARLRPARRRRSGCARAARSTPATCAMLDAGARRRRDGCTHVIHLAAIVGGIANFHKLPHTLTEVNNALYNARRPRRARRARSSASSTSPPRWCSSAPSEFPTHRGRTCPTARRRARPTASPSSPARSTAAPPTTSTACRYTICRPFNAYGPGEMPDAEPGIAHAVPDLIRKVLAGQRPLQIFGSGEQTRTLTHVDDIADGDRHRDGARRPALNEDFNISASRGADRRRDRARRSGRRAARTPSEFELEHLPTLRGRRRSAAGRRSRRPRELLGWEARIGVERGDRRRRSRGCASSAPGTPRRELDSA